MLRRELEVIYLMILIINYYYTVIVKYVIYRY